MPIEIVGVVGAGTIGSGIATALALNAVKVTLVDVSEDQLRYARERIRGEHRARKLLRRLDEDQDTVEPLDHVHFSTDHADLAKVDFVIENVTENWEVKRELYQLMDRICRPDVIFAVNTSAIPIARVASVTQRAPRVVGMHFMNPAAVMPLVEVIRAHHTSEETLRTTASLLQAMGKEQIVVNDSPGFVTNRVMMLTVNEAMFLVHEGVAPARDVDRLFKTCFGHKMGPLETADLIGLDTVLYSLDVLLDEFGDSKYRPCPLLKRKVDAGLFGKKSGAGFYDYGRPKQPSRKAEILQ